MEDAVAVVVLIAADLFALFGLLWTTSGAASGRLKMNGFAGIRTSATMRDESAWRAGHVAALGPARIICGFMGAATLVAVGLLAAGRVEAALAATGVPLITAIAGAVWIVRVANRAARQAPPQS